MYADQEKTIGLINKAIETQQETILKIIKEIEHNVKTNKMIHIFGTGHSHMVGIEMFVRAGGLANVNAMMDFDAISIQGAIRGSKIERISGISKIILEEHQIQEGDIMIIVSNSGRNAMPVEMAIEAKKAGLTTIALTSLEQSMKYESRHDSGKKLYQLVDYVLDSKTPSGDGVIELKNGAVTGGTSTIIGMFLLQTIFSEAINNLDQEGFNVPIYTSQNIDGYDNDQLFECYKGRVKFI